jgi:DNA primase
MGKLGLSAAKYIIHAHIEVEGIVEKPDIIGAIFGQTEGLLGSDLELRELQRNGKIGRIEIEVNTKSSKTTGEIIIPSNLDKTETALIAAILETIEKIGPCNAKVASKNIEDIRVSKRDKIIERAKDLLKELTYNVLPDSLEITEKVANAVRVMEIVSYGKDKLAAGPTISESDEIIIVEGRADVLTLLKNGIKNCIAMNGTSVPNTIKELSKRKTITAFVDGDRGGDLIIKELKLTSEIDFVAKAPDGKEVEELTKKEINKALRSRIAIEQVKVETSKNYKPKETSNGYKPRTPRKEVTEKREYKPRTTATRTTRPVKNVRIPKKEAEKYKEMIEELVGTRGAYILDKELSILGKVPTSELSTTMRNLGSGIHAIVFDGIADLNILKTAERSGIKYVVAMDSSTYNNSSKTVIITKSKLEA